MLAPGVSALAAYQTATDFLCLSVPTLPLFQDLPGLHPIGFIGPLAGQVAEPMGLMAPYPVVPLSQSVEVELVPGSAQGTTLAPGQSLAPSWMAPPLFPEAWNSSASRLGFSSSHSPLPDSHRSSRSAVDTRIGVHLMVGMVASGPRPTGHQCLIYTSDFQGSVGYFSVIEIPFIISLNGEITDPVCGGDC